MFALSMTAAMIPLRTTKLDGVITTIVITIRVTVRGYAVVGPHGRERFVLSYRLIDFVKSLLVERVRLCQFRKGCIDENSFVDQVVKSP